MGFAHCLRNLLHSPRFGDEIDTARYHVLADVAGGEDDFDIGATFVRDLCEFEAAHSRHPDIDEHQADLGTRLKQRQSVMPVVSVKHREAEILEHVDRCGAGQRVVFND